MTALADGRCSRRRVAAALAGCAVGPDYERPSAPVPAAYKEAPRTGDAIWLPAAPADTLDARRLVAPVRRRRARPPRGRGRRREPDRRRRGRVVRAGAGARPRDARRATTPTLGARRERAPLRRRQRLGTRGTRHRRNAFAASLDGDWAPDFWGRVCRSRRGRARRRAGQRRRPRCGAPLGARRARDRLLRAARGRLRGRAAGADDRGLRARAADHAEPLCRRRRRQDRRAAGPDPAGDDARVAGDGARQPRALRARDRRSHRQGAGRLRARAGAVERARAGDAARRAVGACCSAGPTSLRPSARSPPPTPRSASSARRTSPT